MSIPFKVGPDSLQRIQLAAGFMAIDATDQFANVKEAVDKQIEALNKEPTSEVSNLTARIVTLISLKFAGILAGYYIPERLANPVFDFTAKKLGLPIGFALLSSEGPSLARKLVPWTAYFIAAYVINQVLSKIFTLATALLQQSVRNSPVLRGIYTIKQLENCDECAKHMQALMNEQIKAIEEFSKVPDAPTAEEIKPHVVLLQREAQKYKNLSEDYQKQIKEIALQQKLYCEVDFDVTGLQAKITKDLENKWILNFAGVI